MKILVQATHPKRAASNPLSSLEEDRWRLARCVGVPGASINSINRKLAPVADASTKLRIGPQILSATGPSLSQLALSQLSEPELALAKLTLTELAVPELIPELALLPKL